MSWEDDYMARQDQQQRENIALLKAECLMAKWEEVKATQNAERRCTEK